MIIVAQSTYSHIEIGLHDGSNLIQSAMIDKKDACAQLIPTLDALLQKEGISLKDVTHIIVNKGPAPFSSLRTVITTMNGLSFATGIPLIGVSAFEALNHAYNPDGTKTLLIVLRAYSKEYYWGFYAPHAELQIGTAPLDQAPPIPLTADTLVIEHAELAQNPLFEAYKKQSIDYCSLQDIADAGLALLHTGVTGVHHISPLYIKNHF